MKPSPLALLAATCSKIGGTSTEAADASQASPLRAAVVGPNQVILQVGGDIVGQQAVQLQGVGSPAGQVIEITPQMASPASAATSKGTSTVQIVNGSVQSLASSPVNPLLQMSPQMIATPVAGPGGTIAYNIIPQYQTVVVIGADGQEQTVVVPTGSVPPTQQAQSSSSATSTPRHVVQVSQNQVRVQTPASTSTAVSQSASLSGGTVTVNNVTQSGVVNVGATAQSAVVAKQSSVVQSASAPAPHMMSVQIPVTNASGQTVYQTIQVPLPSQPAAAAAPAPLTMYNLFPQQTITLPSPANSAACDVQSSAGAGQVIATADGSGSVKFISVQSPQQQAQQVFTVSGGAVASGGNSPVAMLMAMPQQAASLQQAGGIVQTPSGGGTVLLSNGQVLQTVGGNVCQNIQVVGQPGQLLQGSWAGQTGGSVQLQVRIITFIIIVVVIIIIFSL